ncbi:MAG: hypothetical protein EB084_11230 [Proteobacteria bacterium]|nr:hypothetical protein [Pseudomonadota bacterium]
MTGFVHSRWRRDCGGTVFAPRPFSLRSCCGQTRLNNACDPGFELFHCPSPSSQPEWRSGDEATTEAVAWIREHAADEHWFAWVMIWDIHQARSLLAQGRITAEATDTVYDSGVRSSDRCCGRLLEALKATGQADDTLVVLTGNHGFPHAQTSNHVYGLSEELLHVPLVLWAPGHLSGGRRIDAPVEHGDVTPTILGLVGLPVKGEIGVNALGPLDAHRPLFAQTCDFKCSSVQMDGWRYIEYDRDLELALPGTGGMSGERGSTWKRAGSAELVDVNDVAGESDVSASHPQVVARMRESLHAWEQRTSRVPRAALLPEQGRTEVELLRKHGYWSCLTSGRACGQGVS